MTSDGKRSLVDRMRDRGSGADDDRPEVEAHGALWQAHQQVDQGVTEIVEASAQVLAAAARQQTIVEGLTELANNALRGAAEFQEPLDRLATALDRLRLVALNVGLEGARLGDPAGRALMNVADEVRGNGDRGAEALQDLRAVLEEALPAWQQAAERADELRQSHASIAARVGQQQTVGRRVAREVEKLGAHLRELSDLDPETAMILSQAREHARGLIQALGSLGGRARRDLVRSALGPSLQPLVRTLLEIGKSSRTAKTPK